jgi:phosphoserine phosphatase
METTTTRVILARHGETAWNASETFRGRVDVPLDTRGEEQARLLGAYLSGRNISAVFSSPLKRAWRTAESIAVYHGLGIIAAPPLIDMDYGQWQGLPAVEVQKRYPDIYRCWTEFPEQARIPEGETLEDITGRVLPFFNEIITRYPGKTVVLVSHRVIHKVLICALLEIGNAGFYRIKLDTAGISSFDITGGQAVLVSHNDITFLQDLGGPVLADF